MRSEGASRVLEITERTRLAENAAFLTPELTHQLDADNPANRPACDEAERFVNTEHLHSNIAHNRVGLEGAHNRPAQKGIHVGFVLKQIDAARLAVRFVHQPDLPQQAWRVCYELCRG